jgi:hypothetical protein
MSAFPRQSLTLFSTVTSLAYWVAERFYGHCHHKKNIEKENNLKI